MNKYIKINKLKLALLKATTILLTLTPMSILGLVSNLMFSSFKDFFSLPKNILSLFKSSEKIADERVEENNFKALNSDHKLTKMAAAMAQKEGLKISQISMRYEDYPVMNADIRFPKKNEAIIRFHGNPLDNMDNDNVAEGIIAHELGHKDNVSKAEKEAFLEITQSHLSFGYLTFLLGVFSEQINARKQILFVTDNIPMPLIVPERPSLFAISALSFVIAATIPRIAEKMNHCVEHIADLRGAEIANPNVMMKTLGYLKQIHDLVELRENWAIPEKKMSLRSLWEKMTFQTLYQSRYFTHPSPSDRIGLLQKAFNMNEEGLVQPVSAKTNPSITKNAL